MSSIMNNDNNYNGWTNYATWRVNLELCSDYIEAEITDNLEAVEDMDIIEWAENLEGFVDEMIGIDNNNELADSYAQAFVNQVNFHEIAQHAIERIEDC